jgi:hypothetical protein
MPIFADDLVLPRDAAFVAGIVARTPMRGRMP